MDEINIVAVSDEKYAKYMIVMINSILINNESISPISFYIIDCGIKQQDKDFLINLVKNHKCKISFIHEDYSQCKHFHVRGHISHAAYVKVQMPSLLENLKKIIYLDGDLIVLDDIEKLWSRDVNNTHLYAVCNPQSISSAYIDDPIDKNIFNSGVMLINLDRWRENNIEEKALGFLKENSQKIKLHDQPALNALLHDKWLPLEAKWNVQTSFYYPKNMNTIYKKSEIIDALQNPSIVHFTSNSKPWQFRNAHPYKKKFIEYYKEVFSKKPKYSDINVVSFLKRIKEKIKYI
jgi:lipopolysaccharide biosynthesis glycosyltransferase